MCVKVLAFLALAALVRGNDVIVGLKTDGQKFFDENRQANPALWRQMDNVTITAPENEVIRRIVITDLRPEKDGDVKVVEGGEGQKNVTIELKSPTVLRGYDFHIEVYSTPGEPIPFTNDQQGTTEIGETDASTANLNDPTTSLDVTSKVPDLSTDKIIPAIVSSDEEVRDSERQGRNVNNENYSTSESTTELTSTTFKNDVSTSPVTKSTYSVTERSSDKSSDEFNPSTLPPIPLNKNFNINPAIPAVSGKDFINSNETSNDETRHVRDTYKEISGKTTETYPRDVKLDTTTENDKEASTTETNDSVQTKGNNDSSNHDTAVPKLATFDNRKYTTAIDSKVEHPAIPVVAKDNEKLRNAREVDGESSTLLPTETTTTDVTEETTLSDDCVTTEGAEAQSPVDSAKDTEHHADTIPTYINNRQWNQRLNNPTFQTEQKSPDFKVSPAVLANDQSNVATDAEQLGKDYKPSPDHMENRNPKLTATSGN